MLRIWKASGEEVAALPPEEAGFSAENPIHLKEYTLNHNIKGGPHNLRNSILNEGIWGQGV